MTGKLNLPIVIFSSNPSYTTIVEDRMESIMLLLIVCSLRFQYIFCIALQPLLVFNKSFSYSTWATT